MTLHIRSKTAQYLPSCLIFITLLAFFPAAALADGTEAVHLVEETVADNVVLAGRRVVQWQVDDISYLMVESDVTVNIGSYDFRSENAVVRSRVSEVGGQRIETVWLYLEKAVSPHGKSKVETLSPQLLVTVRTTGEVTFSADLVEQVAARPDEAVVSAAEKWFAGYQASLDKPQATGISMPDDAPGGTVSFRYDRISYRPAQNGETESTVTFVGNVWVVFESEDGKTDISMTAQNAVLILKGDALQSFAADTANVLDNIVGIYLEKDVELSSGNYTIRAPQVYYDLQRHKAVVLDAVFFAWAAELKLPIYLRAKELRQHSLSSWSATEARLTTSEFAEPHFSIAAKTITIERTRPTKGPERTLFTAENTTLQWYDVPMMWFPTLSGDAIDTPLRMVSPGYDNDDGVQIETEWDMFTILSRKQPEGVEMIGRVDYLGERGFGVGLDLDYARPEMFGKGLGYILFNDHGSDRIGNRESIEFNGKTRSVLWVQHKQFLEKNWSLNLELGYVSDETFLEYFFRNLADSGKPFETSIYLKKQQDDWAFDFLLKDQAIDFLPQTTELQTPQYTVDKLPELDYFQIGTSLLDNVLTYQTENRVGLMKITSGTDSPSTRGFSDEQAEELFNFDPGLGETADTTFREHQTNQGITGKTVFRFDTRHEIGAPMKADILDVTPYIAGRATLYDHGFVEYSGEDNDYQLWGAAGLRMHTQFSKVFSNIENQILDIHRLRHIIEPMADVWWSTARVDPNNFPIYDYEVEGIDDGSAVRVGLRNTLQTQRGGQGRWRNVDWLTVDLNFVWREDTDDETNKLPKYVAYRPEFSSGGDHFQANLKWMVSDTLATVGDVIYDFESDYVPQWRIGAAVDHSRRLQSFVDYDSLTDLDSRLFGFGFRYQLTKKYDLGFRQTFDFGQGDSQYMDIVLVRQLPRWQLIGQVRIDEIDDKTRFRVMLVPQGMPPSRLESMVTRGGGR